MSELRFKTINGVIYAGVKPFKGRTKWMSMKTSNLGQAKEMAKKNKLFKMQALESANVLTSLVFSRLKDVEQPTVGAAVDMFIEQQELKARSRSTIASLRTMLDLWMKTMGVRNKLCSEIGHVHFHKFFNPGTDIKYKTLQARQYACVRFCEFCFERAFMLSNHAKAVGIDKDVLTQEQKLTNSHEPILQDEFNRIMTVVANDPFWYLACLIGWEFGLRISDICILEHVSIQDGQLRLVTKKTNTAIKLPLDGLIMGLIAKINGQHYEGEKGFVFPQARAQYQLYGSQPFSQRFAAICKKAGVKKTFHGFRTSFINRDFAGNKASILQQLSEQLAKQQTAAAAGHTTTAATDIYLKAGQQS